VVISHIHGDHVNGLLTADNHRRFPNAEVLVAATEWKFWMDDGEMSRASSERMTGLFKNNRRVFEAGLKKKVSLTTGAGGPRRVCSRSRPSATRRAHLLRAVVGRRQGLHPVDVTNDPDLFARNPGWHLMFDQDPVQAEATRRKVYDMIAAEKMRVQGFHYPFPGLAHLAKDGAGYRWVPAPWNPVL